MVSQKREITDVIQAQSNGTDTVGPNSAESVIFPG
jgi:hypothetical protein